MNNSNIAIERYLNDFKGKYDIQWTYFLDGDIKNINIFKCEKTMKIHLLCLEKKIVYMTITLLDMDGDPFWRRLIQGKYFNNLSGAFKIIELIVSLVMEEEG